MIRRIVCTSQLSPVASNQVELDMELQEFTTRLSANLETIESLVAGVSEEQIRWKPSPKGWSILEVVNHLYDEERDDFRKRLDYLLHRPGDAWKGGKRFERS